MSVLLDHGLGGRGGDEVLDSLGHEVDTCTSTVGAGRRVGSGVGQRVGRKEGRSKGRREGGGVGKAERDTEVRRREVGKKC